MCLKNLQGKYDTKGGNIALQLFALLLGRLNILEGGLFVVIWGTIPLLWWLYNLQEDILFTFSWNLFLFFSLCYSICSKVKVVTCPCDARDIRCVDLHWIKQNRKSEEEKLQNINISFATFLAKGVNVIFLSTTSDLVKQLLRCKMLPEFLRTLSLSLSY